ncbi:serine hydrolase domain-containing protein [Microlunatus speluncae]|uniref:serine hydrolase domain-containing protein n=1 Tax=Microlunatus speluncae TaxID=2594267 RepID=UPI0012664BAE|nr:serine hydrolase domain-containing protein [Microlunatus speluncae]
MTGHRKPEPIEVVRALADRAVAEGHVGVVAGIVSGDRVAIAGAGRIGADGLVPDRRTIFRIASVSKPITATALALAVVRGELGLGDTLHDQLPAWRLPADPFGRITLEQLATHRSGMPHGLDGTLTSIDDYVDALTRVRPATGPGVEYAYSNLGAQLIGMVLTRGAAEPFDAMLRETLAGIAGAGDVVDRLDPDQQARLALGHDLTGTLCETPDHPLGVASGGLHATAESLLALVRAHWSAVDDQLAEALRLTTTPRADAFGGNRIGLLWHLGPVPDGDGLEAIWHNGSLPGYRSFLGFRPDERLGAVVLSNTAKSVDGYGAELLAAA